jgi:2-amino-4-hydroxy-6-hydroxymethyldihydropteridine diphosphokinase
LNRGAHLLGARGAVASGPPSAALAGSEKVLIGLGANVGDPLVQLRAAVQALGGVVEDLAWSSVYRSAPVGYSEQPDFLNLVCGGRCRLEAGALLSELKRIERRLGREPSFRNAPRPIDLDLLAVGDRVIRAECLEVPHPRLHERAFVLAPLAELDPGWRHPLRGATAAEMLRETDPAAGACRVGPLFPSGGGPARG